MEDKVLKFINDHSLLDNADTVTVALSGGADSMALLNVLLSLRKKLGIYVNAAHFNHKLRGAESDNDEQFVKDYCRKNGIELFCQSEDVELFCRNNGISIESGARKLRYDFLKGIAKGLVATAHNANDNLETAIFNLSRGTGLKGLCGIPLKRDIYIRPLLGCSRSEIEIYCNKKNINFVTDSTNLTDCYTRNKIRHNVLPVLRNINPNLELGFANTVESLKQDLNFIDSIATEEYIRRKSGNELILKGFNTLHISVAKRVIMHWLSDNSYNVADNYHLSKIYDICQNSGNVNLEGDIFAVAYNGKLHLSHSPYISDEKRSFAVEIERIDSNPMKNNEKINNLLLNSLLDCDKIVGKLTLRTRCAGDSIKLLKSIGTKSLKKLYNEKKIPIPERDILPVLCDDLGVVWVFEIGVASRCAITSGTRSIYKIKVRTDLGDKNVSNG